MLVDRWLLYWFKRFAIGLFQCLLRFTLGARQAQRNCTGCLLLATSFHYSF